MSKEFQALGDLLNQLSQDVSSYSDALGPASVVRAYGEVANNWWVERGKLIAELSSASQSLLQVAAAYEHDETSLSQIGS